MKATLKNTPEGLVLTDGELSLKADFTEMLPRLKQSNLEHEMIIKAVKIKSQPMPQRVFDATAGLGEDSLILAAAGFDMTLYEYDPVIAALLTDAIDRARDHELLGPVVAKMQANQGDSIEAMKAMAGQGSVDIILLDPMFPGRTKSAKIKKKFQLLQQLERPCDNEQELFEAALGVGAKKIVVKRPVKGPFLAGRKPSHSISGKAVRYDVYI